jgi:hypothetical protein
LPPKFRTRLRFGGEYECITSGTEASLTFYTYIYIYLNVILKKVCTYLNGEQFFFTFPTSEGSDLLSSHVMQTPTFISKLSDGNVIFRLDVGKNK